MKLDDAQKKKVSEWIEQGLKLADIQKRIAEEFKLSLTYMDVRFLVDDLKLIPKEPTPPPTPVQPPAAAPAAGAHAADEVVPEALPEPDALPAAAGKVTVTVDTLARPGAMISGKVTFSDGVTAEWHLDQMGRLGLGGVKPGYKPSASDIQEFQLSLQTELQKMGF